MPLFEYSAYDRQGRLKNGVIEALTLKAASRQLKEQGIYPTRLSQTTKQQASSGGSFWRRTNPLQLGLATRQLATVLTAGMPLDEALALVAEQQQGGELGAIMTRVRDQVLQGGALHASLAAHPRIFPALYTNMVEVGETTGTLDQVLQQLADYLDEQSRYRAQVKAALTYPLLMLVVGSGVLVFLLAFVVPRITRMLEDLDQALPLPTLILMRVSGFLASYWWLVLLLSLLLGWLARRYTLTEKGRLWFDRNKYRLPLFGPLALHSATLRFARSTATLLRSGVPLLTSLAIVENLLGNSYLGGELERIRQQVAEGDSLSEQLRACGFFPSLLVQMTSVGERSGELEGMLFKVADIYEHQVQTRLSGLVALLEPLMILLMGTIVGFIVLAILLPIFQASQGF